MARKMLTREVTKTTVKVAKMEIKEGIPEAIALPDVTYLGNVTAERAQRLVDKDLGQGATVLEVQAETKKYEMEVEEFIKVASVVEEKEEEDENPLNKE